MIILLFYFLGSVNFSAEDAVLTCRSLQRMAEQVQDTEETGRCFHEVIIPRLLSLALQAALQGGSEILCSLFIWAYGV